MLKITQFDQVTRIDSARTIAGRGYYWSTAYLIEGLLVDSGCAHTASELGKALSGRHITSIVNTHSHEDHIGANGALQEQLHELNIYAHPLALPVLANPRKNQPLQFYRRVMWGWPKPSSGQPVEDGAVIETEKFSFQVIYTPGHSPDHICLYEPTHGWLFSGDLFVGGRDRALRKEYRIWEIIAALKRVSELPLSMLFPGCARVRENPSQELADKINYLEETGGKVLDLYKKGMSIGLIARTVFGRPMFIELFTLGHFTRRTLVESYLAEN
jgi:glyoxylase-like metal-dependent hydrolase (beta-lactamase superfamily II)